MLGLVAALLWSRRPSGDDIAITIDTQYVGPGVRPGAAVVLHGVQVGEVATVTAMDHGTIRLVARLQQQPTEGLTDTMRFDYRPVNYFGITGINVIPGEGGSQLHSGALISAPPVGNFTLSELLARLGDATSLMDADLIQVVDRATRYTDGLTPLVETMLIALRAVDAVQTTPAAQLLANASAISGPLPNLVRSLTDAGDLVTTATPVAEYSQDVWDNKWIPTLDEAETGFFAAAGRLLTTHMDDLLTFTQSVTSIMSTVPPLVRPGEFSYSITELRSRLEQMYAGSGDQRALQVRILLDNFPAVTAPLGLGGPQQ
ncbi:Mammalian cell entry related domain protein [Mycolicibacterium neoaurum]|uniref:Mammalian cell entry related domain protein n=1 Tax=Mycolicibacterium neoaurum TaxID=1795 RepID=UPI001BCD4DE0|nr:Mammalian cell entry related domain protein [Mycolicibacterium neoaurum]QVI27222.1 Mammalian cell entry related domain protein [Mycolicibacterium neoaurum]